MSDVVGSTALWERHGDEMRIALETHDRVVHAAVETAGGRVFKHTGDGMIAVFEDADQAAQGALSVSSALAESTWGDTGPLVARVSVHAGTASERNGDYFGPPVNKVARINGIGHAGQVLVSGVARSLMSQGGGIDLGEHQLRDLSEPVRLWQLDDGVHPTLRTLRKARHNLPVVSTEFIGRRAEIDELRGLLTKHRLVTITGVGGCGKTRLAVEVATAASDSYPGGVWFVDLTAENDGSNVGARALAALNLVQEISSTEIEAASVLHDATEGLETLLIVDNCEHLIDDVSDFVAAVLTEAPAVTMLATTREGLAVEGERIWRIPNMSEAAVELFVDRAAAAGVSDLDDHLDLIEDICRQLDDIPLAIELAAGRVSSLSLDELAQRLDDRFLLLGGGRGRRRRRQQTLQTMMDWSYGLLATDEQALLRQLSVFTGTFPLSGAEAVALPGSTPALELMEALVERSLVVPSVDSGRYRLLETVRLYGLDLLINSDELAAARNRHLAWMVGLSGRERMYSIPAGESWTLEEQKSVEVDNALAAMAWAEDIGDDGALLSLFIGGQTCWASTGSAIASWLERIPEPPETEPARQADWRQVRGLVRFNLGDIAGGFEELMQGAHLVDELHQTGQLDPDTTVSPPGIFLRGHQRITAHDFDGALDDARRLDTYEALTVSGPCWAVLLRALVLIYQGDPGGGVLAEEAVEAARSISRFTHDVAVSTFSLQLSLVGRFDEAIPGALACLNSPVLGQSVKVSQLPKAALSLSGVGRHDDALDILETDFGPMIEHQKHGVRAYKLAALAAVLESLGQHERLQQVAAAAWAQHEFTDGYEARLPLQVIMGGAEALAALPAPDPATLTPRSIDSLIDTVVTEIRELISH